ncbi:MAG: transketolase family protein [Alphaproteobacteria bacterium]|nr:transketolase family protein [Alphaproteobacteria bacterium]
MKFNQSELRQMANSARARALHGIRSANSGHVGIALGTADIITTLFAEHLRFNPTCPDWADRDRFVLSAGHGSALLYSTLQLAGYDVVGLSAFRKFGSLLAGHPEYGEVPGVETSTGPLGQGVANAVGMALAAKIKDSDAHIYCLCSDGDLMEGVAQEAVAFAGQYKLDNLTLLWDSNNISIDGVALTDIDMSGRMAAAGFDTFATDGHNPKQIAGTIARAKKSPRPAFIKCRTTIGFGASNAGTAAAHGLALSADELLELEEKLSSEAGEQLWKIVIETNTKLYCPLPPVAPKPARQLSPAAQNNLRLSMSTREASGKILARLVAQNSLLIGGSADLTSSVLTRPENMRDITSADYNGNYVHYGVREHAMAAIMNGLALSGFRPYGGTFLVFSDYMRAAMRLSALMKLPVIYVLSHDSVAVGEDGPTHQPVEHLAALRAIPNMNVFRPADAIETAAVWDMAIAETSRPSCIVLSRQKLSALDTTSIEDAKFGAYRVRDEKNAKVTIIATGSEVSLALDVAKTLEAKKVPAAVVSAPSLEKFRLQSSEYRRKILTGKVVAIEAGIATPWYEFADAIKSIDTFGRNGPGQKVYESFGFDAYKIAMEIIEYLK